MKCRAGVLFLVLPTIFVTPSLRAADAVELPAGFLDQLVARPIGPANTGGRISAIAVVETKPSTMYIAAASGGLWKTTNNGTTWTPVFDNQSLSLSIGDVAVSKSDPDVVWVGTGEANARNSVSWGVGVYKSTDGGKVFRNMGLPDSEHIGRIVIHPKNPDIVYVAALGHLWGPNKERGIFKTTDGGATWKPAKQIDEHTGFIDLAMDPGDPDTLYAAAYKVRRDAFAGGNPATQFGDDAGLYKTTDGGKTWNKLTKGLPERPIGRCGIDIWRKNPNIVYAVIQTDRTDMTAMPGQPPRTSDKVETGGVFRSTDKGESWTKVNDLCPRPFYFGQVRIDPTDDQRVYVLGVTLFVSTNGGKNFRPDAPETHADHHSLWIDPADPQHLVYGTDGGVFVSYDRGVHCEHVQNLPIGQFYGIALDMGKPYRVFGGLQDNGTWGGPTRTKNREGIGVADWFRILSADGYLCQCDPTDNDTVYAESQWGGIRRIDLHAGTATEIRPRPPRSDDPAYRFNWCSPMLVSPHNAKTLYFGGNHVFKSINRGDTWEVISPDLTTGEPGPNKYAGHTITTIAESPVKAGVLWAGTDDGNLQVSTNGGRDWTDLSAKIPEIPGERWISRVECSPFDLGTAYVAIDRHRNNDRSPYVFKTDDFGVTWKSIASNLPTARPVHVIRADPRNRDLLYVGTEFGLFFSIDAGTSWYQASGALPTVAIHDLAIHPRDRELVIATHGRSIYVMDIAPLQELTTKTLAAPIYLFDVKPATAYQPRGAHGLGQGKNYLAPNPPFGATIYYMLKEQMPESVVVTITDPLGKTVAELKGPNRKGLHKVQWGLRGAGGRQEGFVPTGDYVARLKVGDQMLMKKFHVENEE
jgi:photosystem II stability/assembly factor-like uncharacterized protein